MSMKNEFNPLLPVVLPLTGVDEGLMRSDLPDFG